ncbi:hypothetical protein Acr_00g0011000 [Actinidia rufa]|uniref:Uncharacterized protein n=1 Tax=Actinidia rufa TaxID=165716 RepID=A0A7J0D9A8_9ERIC|nr:hypothetical protein Acr_00g0011000 [Actinidia rufa]
MENQLHTRQEKGGRLLVDAPLQEKAKATKPTDGESHLDKAMRRMVLKMEEMTQILVANNLKLHANRVDESLSEVQAIERDVLPRGSQTVASSKHKDPSRRAISGVDLHHLLNAKKSKEGADLRVKLAVDYAIKV